MTEYLCEFGFYREDGEPIDQGVIDELTDSWVEAIEAHGLYTGGGITRCRRIDAVVNWIWMRLWGIKWLRKEV